MIAAIRRFLTHPYATTIIFRNKHFYATVTGRWGSHDAEVRVYHDSDQEAKRRAEMAVIVAGVILHVKKTYGFTTDEIRRWEVWRL